MTFKEIKIYLYGDCIVRNYNYEYKTENGDMFCRRIGEELWCIIYKISDNEKMMEWELVVAKSKPDAEQKMMLDTIERVKLSENQFNKEELRTIYRVLKDAKRELERPERPSIASNLDISEYKLIMGKIEKLF